MSVHLCRVFKGLDAIKMADFNNFYTSCCFLPEKDLESVSSDCKHGTIYNVHYLFVFPLLKLILPLRTLAQTQISKGCLRWEKSLPIFLKTDP